MITVEIDTGAKIEKYEYIGEDIDTYIVSSDDIDLSQEGFILKQRESTSYTVESKSVFYSLPLRSVHYNVNIIEKKCKIVKQEDVIRCYEDWNKSRSYFCGIECSYKEMDGFIRIESWREPQGLMNEFTYKKYLLENDDHPPLESSCYYKDIPYDDVRFQRDVITKKHIDYIVNVHGITKETNEEERKQLTIEYLIDKLVSLRNLNAKEPLNALLIGSYGYRIPDKLYATDLDSVFDKVLPRAYELISAHDQNAGHNFLSALANVIEYSYMPTTPKRQDIFASDMFFIEDGKIVYPSEDYAFFIKILLQLKLMNKHKNQEYPYTLLYWRDLKEIYYHWRARSSYAKYLTRHNPVYWNNKVVCDDLGDYVKNAMKEMIYFKQLH